LLFSSGAVTLQASELAIVIDDVGYNLNRAERILALPVELTLGMLPFAPHAQLIAERAHQSGREVILHQPMEPLVTRRIEPGTLQASMTVETFDRQFAESLSQLPQVAGVNNHTGSLLTSQRIPMEWLMANIAERGLYFLDSRTTPHTVAESTARDWAVPTIRRDVFLDHIQSSASLEAAFERSLAIARRQGHAVVIAHPHTITLDFLEEKLETLPDDIRLTNLRSLVEPVRPLDRTTLVLLGNPGSPNISLGQ
jgi:polysaccharide deacetylase 2 family uncharacterized protein YibQ